MAKQTIQTNLLGQRVEVSWIDFDCEHVDLNQCDYGTIRNVYLFDGKPWYTVELEGLGNENIGSLKDFPQDRVTVNSPLRKEYCGFPCEGIEQVRGMENWVEDVSGKKNACGSQTGEDVT